MIEYSEKYLRINGLSKHDIISNIKVNPIIKYNIDECNNFITFNKDSLIKEKIKYSNIYNEDLKIRFPSELYTVDSIAKYQYCFDTLFSERWPYYFMCIDICKKYNIKRVLENRCGAGIQSLFFNDFDIKYTGIDYYSNYIFPYYINEKDDVEFYFKEFPFKDELYCNNDDVCFICSFNNYYNSKEEIECISRYNNAIILYNNKELDNILKNKYNNIEMIYNDKYLNIILLRR